jgi:hypothetical protein
VILCIFVTTRNFRPFPKLRQFTIYKSLFIKTLFIILLFIIFYVLLIFWKTFEEVTIHWTLFISGKIFTIHLHYSFHQLEVSHSPYSFNCFVNSLGEIHAQLYDFNFMLVLLKRITRFTWLITCISLVCLITCISCDLFPKHYYLFIWPHCHPCLSGDIVSIVYMTSLSLLFTRRHCQTYLHDLIVIVVYLATLSALPKIVYIAVLLYLSWNLDTSITFVHVDILHLAVGS